MIESPGGDKWNIFFCCWISYSKSAKCTHKNRCEARIGRVNKFMEFARFQAFQALQSNEPNKQSKRYAELTQFHKSQFNGNQPCISRKIHRSIQFTLTHAKRYECMIFHFDFSNSFAHEKKNSVRFSIAVFFLCSRLFCWNNQIEYDMFFFCLLWLEIQAFMRRCIVQIESISIQEGTFQIDLEREKKIRIQKKCFARITDFTCTWRWYTQPNESLKRIPICMLLTSVLFFFNVYLFIQNAMPKWISSNTWQNIRRADRRATLCDKYFDGGEINTIKCVIFQKWHYTCLFLRHKRHVERFWITWQSFSSVSTVDVSRRWFDRDWTKTALKFFPTPISINARRDE